jgi:hypothetical protein
MLKVDIREGVDINTCRIRFCCKIEPLNRIFDNSIINIVLPVNTIHINFIRYECWNMLHIIARTLDEGGGFVVVPDDFIGSTLRVVSSNGKYMATIGAYVNNHDANMAGVVMGYAEAWITSSDTHTQIRSVQLIEPFDGEEDQRTLYLPLTRLRSHRVLAKTLRTAEANQPYISPVRLAWVCSVMRFANTRPTPPGFKLYALKN